MDIPSYSYKKWTLVVIFSLLLNFGGLLEQGDAAATGYGTLGSLVTGGVAL